MVKLENEILRLKAELAEAQAEKAKLRAVIDNALNAIILVNQVGVVVDWNERARNLFGWTKEDAIGKELGELGIPAAFSARCKYGIEKFLTTGQLSNLGQLHEMVAVKRDGSTFPVQISMNAVRTGKVCTFIAFVADITERKITQAALEESELFLRSIIENIPFMIFMKEAKELRFVKMNKAGEDLLGVPRKNLLGKNDYDFFPDAQADFFTAKDREVLASDRMLSVEEEEIKTKNLGTRILRTKKLVVTDPKGENRYLLGISEDITDKKRVENELRSVSTPPKRAVARKKKAA